MKHNIATSSNGKAVYAYLMQPSSLAQNIARNPHLLVLIKEAVTPASLTQPTVNMEQDMGRPIGYADLLETREKDVIFYARQVRAAAYTKFVKNRRTDATSFLTLNLRQDESGDYEVIDAWIGKNYPPFPGEEGETELSQSYWADHAVVFNGQALMASTITKDCPY